MPNPSYEICKSLNALVILSESAAEIMDKCTRKTLLAVDAAPDKLYDIAVDQYKDLLARCQPQYEHRQEGMTP